MWPLSHTWAYRCPWLASLALIGRGSSIASLPPREPVSLSWISGVPRTQSPTTSVFCYTTQEPRTFELESPTSTKLIVGFIISNLPNPVPSHLFLAFSCYKKKLEVLPSIRFVTENSLCAGRVYEEWTRSVRRRKRKKGSNDGEVMTRRRAVCVWARWGG